MSVMEFIDKKIREIKANVENVMHIIDEFFHPLFKNILISSLGSVESF